jgi:hypothetical protein
MMSSSVDDAKLVVWDLPSRLTDDPLMNPEPVKVTGVFGDPTAAEIGEMLLNDGRGFEDDTVDVLGLPTPPLAAQPMSDVKRITVLIKEM